MADFTPTQGLDLTCGVMPVHRVMLALTVVPIATSANSRGNTAKADSCGIMTSVGCSVCNVSLPFTLRKPPKALETCRNPPALRRPPSRPVALQNRYILS